MRSAVVRGKNAVAVHGEHRHHLVGRTSAKDLHQRRASAGHPKLRGRGIAARCPLPLAYQLLHLFELRRSLEGCHVLVFLCNRHRCERQNRNRQEPQFLHKPLRGGKYYCQSCRRTSPGIRRAFAIIKCSTCVLLPYKRSCRPPGTVSITAPKRRLSSPPSGRSSKPCAPPRASTKPPGEPRSSSRAKTGFAG